MNQNGLKHIYNMLGYIKPCGINVTYFEYNQEEPKKKLGVVHTKKWGTYKWIESGIGQGKHTIWAFT